MIDRHHGLHLNRQARALGISRGSVYSLPRAASSADLAWMRAIEALPLEYAFAGSRRLQVFCWPRGMSLGVSMPRR